MRADPGRPSADVPSGAQDRAPAGARLGTVRRVALFAALALATVAALVHGWRTGVPVAIGEPGAQRIDCLSYAPFRRPGETPFDPQAFVTVSRIEDDLRRIASRTGCVRTYGVSQGIDAVPAVAERLGMTVLLGAWLGRDRRANETELRKVIEVARRHPQTVRAVVVGNEVMLRGELPEAELIAHVARVRAAVPMPVTYADVWEFWLKHPAIANAVSFVTIHVLPYWEDDPVGIDEAIGHVVSVWHEMRRRLPGQEIVVGETGWPSEGRARGGAVPGRIEQARFVRQFTGAAVEHGIRYNLIEAFDQPWKRALEGAMGGAWGLFDSDGHAKFDWHGPVAPRDRWTAWRGSALCGALLGAAGFAWAGRRRHATLHAAVGAIGGAGLGAALAEQVRYLIVWNRWPLEWAATGAATLAVLAACVASALWLARRLADGPPGVLPPAAVTVGAWMRDGRRPGLDAWVSLLHAAVLLSAAVTVVLHGFDGRYRGFDLALFAPAAVAAVLLRAAGAVQATGALEERWLAVVLVAGAVAIGLREGAANLQALGYCGLMLVLGGCALVRASTSRPSSTPTAAGSAL